MGFVARQFWVLPILVAVVGSIVLCMTNKLKVCIDGLLATHHRCLWTYQKYVCLMLPLILYCLVIKESMCVLNSISMIKADDIFWVYEWSLISIISLIVAFVVLSYARYIRNYDILESCVKSQYLPISLFVVAFISWVALCILFCLLV